MSAGQYTAAEIWNQAERQSNGFKNGYGYRKLLS